MKLHNVVFPRKEGEGANDRRVRKWDVELLNGKVQSVQVAQTEDKNSNSNIASQLLLPPLCHPHLHLDKAYLWTGGSCGCDNGNDSHGLYDDLQPQTGDFAEALRTTATAKTRFTAADIYRRGAQLLATSYRQGVTSARVFVEVDAQTGAKDDVVDVAGKLQKEFRGRVAVQVCAFAQEVLFSGEEGEKNREAIEQVLERQEEEKEEEKEEEERTVQVLGSAPYVEASWTLALQNLDWAVTTALRYGLHLDLHLDYHLDATRPAMVWDVLEALERHRWPSNKTVVVGHATRWTKMSRTEMERLAAAIEDGKMPLYVVGLPTSDVYMMGRSSERGELERVLGTLNILPSHLPPPLASRACLGVNNVGNAFTPHGTGDPLQMACWGVGLYHGGTAAAARQLYGAVSWRARRAIGMEEKEQEDSEWWDVDPEELVGKHIGQVLVVANERSIPVPKQEGLPDVPAIPARTRSGFRDVVWDPPDVALRSVV